MSDRRYASPQALRHGVTERLRRIAREKPGTQLQDLQRQFAYDRFLCRIFMQDPEHWVLKGATAMLARLEGVARHTRDIDLYRRGGDLGEAEAALRDCAAVDLGDWFRFTLEPGRMIEPQGAQALRIRVVAFLGASEFADFHVDLVTNVVMTGTPEDIPPLVPVDVPGVPRVSYRVYPVADHIADKVCALLEKHVRASGAEEPSSRYRDLADIVTFAHSVEVDAESLRAAIRSESDRRSLRLPDHMIIPDSGDWPAGYARVARDAPGLAERDLPSAVSTASRFLDPLLEGRATGRWDPASFAWR